MTPTVVKQARAVACTVHGTINKELAFQRATEFHGQNPFRTFLKQGAENAHDERATSFRILLNRKTGLLALIDNGNGFDAERVQDYFTPFDSYKRRRPSSRTIGRNGSGRFAAFQFTTTLRVYSRSAAFGTQPITFTLERSDITRLCAEGITRSITYTDTLPDCWDLTGTGTLILLEGVDWTLVDTPSDTLRSLGEQLSPFLARIVTVNGESLRGGETLGAPITIDEMHPQLGQLRIFLYRPVEKRRGRDTLDVGGTDKIMPFDALREALPERYADLVPPELLSGVVCGFIGCEELNRYRASDTSSFERDLYTNSALLDAYFDLLTGVVAPRIRTLLEDHAATKRRTRRTALINSLSSFVSRAWSADPAFLRSIGDDGTKQPAAPSTSNPRSSPHRSTLEVRPRHLTLQVGEKVTLRVADPLPTAAYLWDATKSGGTLAPLVGSEVVLTTGSQPGDYQVAVRDGTAPHAPHCVVSVRVITDRDLQVSPAAVDVTRGTAVMFQLRNPGSVRGKAQWRLQETVAGVVLNSSIGDFTIVMADEHAPLGEQTLICTDSADPLRCASVRFHVVEPPRVHVPRLTIDGHSYVLVEGLPGTPVAEAQLKAWSGPQSAERLDVMRVNIDHQAVRDAQSLGKGDDSNGFFLYILPHLVAAHLDATEAKTLRTATDFRDRCDSIVEKVLSSHRSAPAK